MLNENIKTLRKQKGLSQEELAVKLNVVRQTISKWEQGLSVPDAEMLIQISEVFEIPVSELLGENITKEKNDELTVIAEKLEVINLQLVNIKETRRKKYHYFFILFGIAIVVLAVLLAFLGSPYLGWNYNDPEYAVLGVQWHIFEFVFFRIAPIALIGAIVGAVMTRKKR